MKRILILTVLGALVISLIVILATGPKQTSNTSNPNASGVSDSSLSHLSDLVTIKGWLICLPAKTSSINCIIGLRDAKGNNYGLVGNQGQALDATQFSTGASYTAVGYYVANPLFLNNYQIQKTIEINH